MKQFRTTLIFATLVAGFLAYVYVFEVKKPKEEEKVKEMTAKVVPFEADQITQMNLTLKGSEFLLKKSAEPKDGSRWSLEKPVKDIADDSAISDFVRDLVGRSTELIVEEIDPTKSPEAKWEVYGLNSPAGKIEISTGDNKKVEVWVGAKKAMGDKAYLKKVDATKPDNKVYLATAAWNTDLDKNLKTFRDKKIVHRDLKGAQKIALNVAGKVIAFNRKDNNWLNGKEPQDSALVLGLVNSVEELRAIDVVSENANDKADLKKFNLEKPHVTAQFEISDKDAVVVEFSKEKDHAVFVKIKGGEKIYQVQDAVLASFQRKPEEFRSRDIPFKLDGAQVKKVQLQLADKKFVFTLKDTKWEMLEGAAPENTEFDSGKVIDLISHLTTRKAAMYVNPNSFGEIRKAKNKIQFLSDKDKLLELTWMDKPKEENTSIGQSNLSKDLFTFAKEDAKKWEAAEFFKPKSVAK